MRLHLKDIEKPVDVLSPIWGPQLEKLKAEHDHIVKEYDAIQKQYNEKCNDVLEQFMKDNIEYAFQFGCRHTGKLGKRPWAEYPDHIETYCIDCDQAVAKDRFWSCPHYLTKEQADLYLKLWQYVYKTFKSFPSFDCEHEYCC